MRTELIRGITVRPLRNGERAAVQAVFDQLGPRSRLLRFGGAKNVLTPAELDTLARVDDRHLVLVALIDGHPVGIARLVRDLDDPALGEIAFAVGDEWQGRGIGSVLVDRLACVARAAGIERLSATISTDNHASLKLMSRVTNGLKTTYAAGQLEVVGRAA
jgi:GNAT superfamily N-acetyltransferase